MAERRSIDAVVPVAGFARQKLRRTLNEYKGIFFARLDRPLVLMDTRIGSIEMNWYVSFGPVELEATLKEAGEDIFSLLLGSIQKLVVFPCVGWPVGVADIEALWAV